MFEVRPEIRARSLAFVLAAHGIAIWLVLAFAHTSFIRERETIVGVFDVSPPVPPPPLEPPPPTVSIRQRQGAAAPARPAARPTPALIAPTVQEPNAPPLPAPGGPQAQPDGIGGGGTGGAGSGGGSTGAGSGGAQRPIVPPRLRSGEIVPRDYPRSAAGAQGSVVAQVAVGADGRVAGCSVARSSGNAILDATTCRLIRERFRFTPARNAQGEAVPGEYGWRQRWWRD